MSFEKVRDAHKTENTEDYLEIISDAMYPRGCPTCNPDPDGYGNMSRT